MLLLQTFLELGERAQAMALVFADPTLRDVVDRNRIEIVQLLAAALDGRDEVRAFQDGEVLAHGLARHRRSGSGQPLAKLVQGLAVRLEEPIEQLPAARI